MVSQVCLAPRNCSGHGTRHWYSAAQLPESEYCGKIFRCAYVTASCSPAQVAFGLACAKSQQCSFKFVASQFGVVRPC